MRILQNIKTRSINNSDINTTEKGKILISDNEKKKTFTNRITYS